jgi:hypothetical protein
VPPPNFDSRRDNSCAVTFAQLRFGEEPIVDVMSVLAAALQKQLVGAAADVAR